MKSSFCVQKRSYIGVALLLTLYYEMGTPQTPRPDTVVANTCEDHSRLVWYSCDECNVLVCDKCITTTHKAHPISDIKEYIRSQRNILTQVFRDSEKYLDSIKRHIKLIELRLADNDRRTKNSIKKLRKRGEILKKEIDKIVEENVQRCKDTKKKNKEGLDRLRAQKSDSVNLLEKHISDCESLYKMNELDKILQAVDISKTMVTQTSSSSPFDTTLDIFCSKGSDVPNDSLINDLLGFEMVEEKLSDFEPHLQVVADTEKGDIVWGISLTSGGNVSVGYEGCYELEIRTSDAELIDSIEVDSCLYDMSFQNLQGNPVLLTSNEDKEIQHTLMNTGLKPETIFVTKGEPTGLCLAVNGDIIVASSLPTSLVKYDINGKRKESANIDNKGKQLLTEPRRVKINPFNDDVYVINSTPDVVAVFNKRLQYQFTYGGEKKRRDSSSQGDTKSTFKPTDVDFDSEGNVLVVDNCARAILMLDSFGNFLRTMMIDENGPYSICVHENKSLWVGYEDGTLKVFKYSH